jgi:hypothetical protein
MSLFELKPTHAPVKKYYEALAQFQKLGHTTEGNTRSAFADLLKKSASPYKWHLVESLPFRGTGKQRLIADGAIVDSLGVVQGLWETKDDDDNLDKEIRAKVRDGYLLTNIVFQSPSRAVLYQNNRIEFDDPITTPEKLIDVLKLFLDYTPQPIVDVMVRSVEEILHAEFGKSLSDSGVHILDPSDMRSSANGAPPF